jgi:hypothetical protein
MGTDAANGRVDPASLKPSAKTDCQTANRTVREKSIAHTWGREIEPMASRDEFVASESGSVEPLVVSEVSAIGKISKRHKITPGRLLCAPARGGKMTKPGLTDIGWLGPKDEMDRASRFGKCSKCREIICVEKAVTDGPSTLRQTSEQLFEAFRKPADLEHGGGA